MAKKFKLGDVVRFNSGGPLMTVTDLTEEDGKIIAECTWFGVEDQDELIYWNFAETSLRHEETAIVEEISCRPFRIQ
jgi:uncharacterized protein YodC (DUF2158 family)